MFTLHFTLPGTTWLGAQEFVDVDYEADDRVRVALVRRVPRRGESHLTGRMTVSGDVGFTTAPGEMVAVVSEDPATGASTVLIKLPPGWKSQGPERHTCLQEELLLEGDLSLEGRELSPFSYLCFPAGHVHGPLSTRNGCIVLAWHNGPVDVEYLGG